MILWRRLQNYFAVEERSGKTDISIDAPSATQRAVLHGDQVLHDQRTSKEYVTGLCNASGDTRARKNTRPNAIRAEEVIPTDTLDLEHVSLARISSRTRYTMRSD